MALAPFHKRAALAAAQILDGFDEAAFSAALDSPVGLAWTDDAASSIEGRALLDLAIRLLARLYPAIELRGQAARDELAELANRINPDIEFAAADIGICVGRVGEPFARTIYAGSDGWDALISTSAPRPIGLGNNALGAGAAACLAAANLFRLVMLPDSFLDDALRYSTFDLDRSDEPTSASPLPATELEHTAMVGLGAIGNAVAWALGRSQVSGRIDLVDHEVVELSNLQRYVLTELSDVGKAKTEVAAAHLAGDLEPQPATLPFAEFVTGKERKFERIAVGVDNPHDRVAVQSALPRVAFNAWTQPGDLGVSIHPHFGRTGACLACLYLPDHALPNDDELVAQGLGVPERVLEIRTLLATNAQPSPELLQAVAAGLGVNPTLVEPFANQPIRKLYIDGVCGGLVLPLGSVSRPAQDVHVPLAHQSALAGVLLAARLLRHAANLGPDLTLVSRVDVLKRVGVELTQPRQRAEGRRCLCGDEDFLRRYAAKWNPSAVRASELSVTQATTNES
jgi:ThiF family